MVHTGPIVVSMITKRLLQVAVALTPFWLAGSPADAQLFGPRQLGRPLARQPSPGIDGTVGTLRNQRFIRGNRRIRDFVGLDRRDRAGFVGIEQAESGQLIQSAVTSVPVTVPEGSGINQPMTPPAADQMYPPRLVVRFDHPARTSLTTQAQLDETLPIIGPRIAVSVVGQTAILRGEVSSEGQRRLAEALCLLEPGVSSVQNDLTVAAERSLPDPPGPDPNR